jgi:hypothetical protein
MGFSLCNDILKRSYVCKLSNKNFIGTRKSKFQCRNVIHMKTLGQTRLMSVASQDVADILTNNLDCINLL